MVYVLIVIVVHFFSYCPTKTKADVSSIGSGPPNLDDLVKTHCPAEKPFICLPYGVCCAGHEFCYSGTCETCFPKAVKEDVRLAWCKEKGQYDVTSMRHQSCSFACQAVFNSSVLSPLNDEIIDYEKNISMLIRKLVKATEVKDTHNSCLLGDVWSGFIGGILGAALAIVICFLIKYRQSLPGFVPQVQTHLPNYCRKQNSVPSIEEEDRDLDPDAAEPMMEEGAKKVSVGNGIVLHERSGTSRQPQVDQPTLESVDTVPVDLTATASLSIAARI